MSRGLGRPPRRRQMVTPPVGRVGIPGLFGLRGMRGPAALKLLACGAIEDADEAGSRVEGLEVVEQAHGDVVSSRGLRGLQEGRGARMCALAGRSAVPGARGASGGACCAVCLPDPRRRGRRR